MASTLVPVNFRVLEEGVSIVIKRRLRHGLFAAVVFLAVLVPGAGAVPSELFFSEYVEGSSNNKALEIYNGTGASIPLAGYDVQICFNGNPVCATTIALTGSVPPGDVFVVADDDASAPILAQANQTSSANWFNGDDVVLLRKSGVVIDSFGQLGVDPGTEWGSGLASGQDNTLRRKAGIEAGDTNTGDAFNPATEWDGFAVDTFDGLGCPGGQVNCPPPTPPGDPGTCDAPATLISAIQGSGTSSPLLGTQQTIEGVITGDYDGAGGLNGYFVQEEDGDRDSNAATSEGIFVAHVSPTTIVGDLVRVVGTVAEPVPTGSAPPNSMTRLGNVTGSVKCSSGNSVTTTELSLPGPAATNAPTTFEPLEGMHVRMPQSLVISEYFNYERFGELVLGLPLEGETRHFTPTLLEEPSTDPASPAQQRFAAYLRSRITLDDGLGIQNPSFTRHPNGAGFALDNRFRGGDKVANTVGVLAWDFGLWRIQPTGPATYTPVNARPGALSGPEGIRVATMNTLNFFLTLDIEPNTTPRHPDDEKCGPARTLECRGADSNRPEEFGRQRTKLLAALAGLDADVIGLNELENTTGVDPLGDPNGIVPGLNAMPGVGPYAAIATGTIGTDAIKVGLIYRSNVVRPLGPHQILDSTDDPRFIDTRSRPVLAQTFEVIATGARFTVAVNHLKSKGSACLPDDPDTGDLSGNCNKTRTAAAQALVDWLATDPTGSDDPDFLIMGDLNAYAKEDPIDAVKAGPDDVLGTADDYTNLVERYEGRFAYSFVFDGQAGYLDHGLANSAIVQQVLDAAEWHINADEPDILDYDTSFKSAAQATFFEPNQFRSADHDPLVVTLCGDLTACAIDRLHAVAEELEELIAAGDKKVRDKLEDVLAKVESALRRLERTRPNRQGAAGDLEGAAGDLQAAVRADLVATPVGNALLTEIAQIARLLAVDAIEEAKAGGGKADKIAEAERSLARGDARLAAGRFTNAIGSYRDALAQAEGA
jgi:predicted extracellular nuclease